MTKPKPHPTRAVDAVQAALDKEQARRSTSLKPIEIVKVAMSAFQKHRSYDESANAKGADRATRVESDDRAGFRRGTQASIDRILFNANYWCAAYEDRIVNACTQPEDARALLKVASVWTTHTLKLSTLSNTDVIATFERFCPPFSANKRHGADADTAKANSVGGKGPVIDFKKKALEYAEHGSPEVSETLCAIIKDMEAEVSVYDSLDAGESLDALFAALPAWCIQDRIPLVSSDWWNDSDVIGLVTKRIAQAFRESGFGEPICQYYVDSCLEIVDGYQREVSTERSPLANLSVGELVELVRSARQAHPDSEVEGYGSTLPPWLIYKEQLIWNVVVCAIYGPVSTRPLLVNSPSLLGDIDNSARTDVITELAQTSYERYTTDRTTSDNEIEFSSYADQPVDLQNSGIEYIRSIPKKLEILGYGIMPIGSCYPDQRVFALTSSEIECLAILEHRRWLLERTAAGWKYAKTKNIDAKESPYLIPWENLSDRAREWNRSAVRNIPMLLASYNLAIVRERQTLY